jgi:hypothetical protein
LTSLRFVFYCLFYFNITIYLPRGVDFVTGFLTQCDLARGMHRRRPVTIQGPFHYFFSFFASIHFSLFPLVLLSLLSVCLITIIIQCHPLLHIRSPHRSFNLHCRLIPLLGTFRRIEHAHVFTHNLPREPTLLMQRILLHLFLLILCLIVLLFIFFGARLPSPVLLPVVAM